MRLDSGDANINIALSDDQKPEMVSEAPGAEFHIQSMSLFFFFFAILTI